MSEAKFTSGPWGVIKNRIGSIEIVFEDGNSFRGREYLCISPLSCKDDYECIHSGETAEANAHLIAASPKMYKKLDEICEGLLEAGGIGNVTLAREIENLLKEARGEQ